MITQEEIDEFYNHREEVFENIEKLCKRLGVPFENCLKV